MKRNLLRIVLAMGIAVALIVSVAVIRGGNGPHTTSSASLDSRIFGVNMPLFDAGEQLLNTPTQTIVEGWHTPVIRMPFRSGLADAVETQALQAIKTVGATPLVIIHGAADATVATDDPHLLSLVSGVFGSSLVYVEYGNEEDLAGINDVGYTASWNAVIPGLKAAHPTYQFIGPVNFQTNAAYIAYFVQHAIPAPDLVSWHEYVCSPTDDFQAVCMAHLANWVNHVQNTNAAEIAAIGHTVPFMITEWNMDPQTNDPRYSNSAQIEPWTTQALQDLNALIPLGLVGAQQYALDSHQDFALINASDGLTPQGTAWQVALGSGVVASPSPTPTPSPITCTLLVNGLTLQGMCVQNPDGTTTFTPTIPPTPSSSPSPSSVPSPSPSPTLNPSPSPSPIPSPTPSPLPSFLYDFEDGATQGWSSDWGAISVANSTAQAFSGTHSLAITTSGGYPAVAVAVAGIASGSVRTYHVWTSVAVTVMPFVTDNAFHNTFVSSVKLNAGWNTLIWTVPSVSGVTHIGLQVNNFNGVIYLDAVS